MYPKLLYQVDKKSIWSCCKGAFNLSLGDEPS